MTETEFKNRLIALFDEGVANDNDDERDYVFP